jgi:hypothetical protein
MKTLAVVRPMSGPRPFARSIDPKRWLREAFARQPLLTGFAVLMWLAMVPALLALGLDERSLRGVSVWVKPLKFLASVGLFSICTAWFIGLLPEHRRDSLPVRVVVWTILLAGGFEIAYITLMASLGQASHYNFSNAVHVALYSAMGAGALAMTATQPLLAWQIARHGRGDLPSAWRDAVVLGLMLTFLLGAGAGGLLGGIQPPAGAGLPVVGWHMGGGDLPYTSTMSYCSCPYAVSTCSEICLPIASPSAASGCASSSRNRSITPCEARMRNSFGLNWRASRWISRRIS